MKKKHTNLLYGDCLEILRGLDSACVDSLITDPPAGISFMGKAWDEDKGGRKQWIAWMSEVMTECLRVLKPGAHGLVWAIPRTSHWTATALEDAGFEIRDVVTHIFGSGFPKSMDISKAIDKQAGAEREVTGIKAVPGGFQRGTMNDDGWKGAEQFETAPSTPEAKQWQGWGTALKPASEHWILVRKPTSEKTVAANVLRHGIGGINIDASRIGTEERTVQPTGTRIDKGEGRDLEKFKVWQDKQQPKQVTGRFPANLVLSHNPDCVGAFELEDFSHPAECTPGCAVAALDAQGDALGAGRSNGNGNKTNNNSGHQDAYVGGQLVKKISGPMYNDKGSVSRFFYVAKASKKDKGADNSHPTVKSSTLMSYLIKLITPPEGVVLDPFMGSGSTGVAALKEGFEFIGIEKEPEYFSISEKRIQNSFKDTSEKQEPEISYVFNELEPQGSFF